MMKKCSRDHYEIDYYKTPNSNDNLTDQFAPSLESLKAAQAIVRRYEKRRRAAAKLSRPNRGAAVPQTAVAAAISDNVIAFRSPVWARPSSTLVYSRHTSAPYTLSPAPHARRASLQGDVRRRARYDRISAPWPPSPLEPAINDGVQSDIFQNVGVMAIQAMAVALGLTGLLMLLLLL